MTKYLFDNSQSGALERLRALEHIEDEGTIAALERLPALEGLHCLELGAGAGSIAAWLANHVGCDGRVVATDVDAAHLDSSRYAVLQHDIRADELPVEAFDLVHVRHVLIHLADPLSALEKIRTSMRPGAHLIVEESDMRTWSATGNAAEALNSRFQQGVRAVLQVYSARGMNIALGSTLAERLRGMGFAIIDERSTSRAVSGTSAEARYQKLSVIHLARSIQAVDSGLSRALEAFAPCFDDSDLKYQSRTTVAVTASRER